ncbi:hypothetical protein C0584_03415 [Candidatus Parcubacteria bacterium]|nr:MAG: hypothetical protein C0584_03415 [Candidatus Parcubacteria bacterium]
MKKPKFENLEYYSYILVFIIVISISIFFYSFLQKNLVETISSSNVVLDPASIRIVDINLQKFETVLSNLEEKTVYTEVDAKDIFR